ncbi:NAD(P)/FAD-dependent oxidoreductase [Amycolatopsis palatopharyngis]|uniref:FAD/NAD(P)-dependent oxidoreductase n=1 Tax=Amycolatopsis palatopharyngis TaxID=187982 RepID=UPI000E264885|nr:NAD(P)/FAD-dependent oxidoreductase [Amycolatopsis palatopharyngis]
MNRVVVVGAGPAGMAAARAAAAAAVPVTLIDSAALLGGQYHRQDATGDGESLALPGAVDYLPNTVVWAVEPIAGGHRVHLLTGPADGPGRRGTSIDTAALVLATGAYDRTLPFPGWDLPGVYTAGAAQALAKGQGTAVGKRVLLAGTGPFLLPVAEAVLRTGSAVVAVHEANDPFRGWLRQPSGLLAGWGKAGELARYLAVLATGKVPYRRRSTVIAAHGDERVESVTTARLDRNWNILAGSERRIDVDAVCVGFGFTPQLELAVSAKCAIRDGFVAVDTGQATSVPGVLAAGELTGIGGAVLAAAEGAVAGTTAARILGARPGPPVSALRQARSARRFAAALDEVYSVKPGWQDWLHDDTLVCRCEEVGFGELCRAVEEREARDVRSLKLLSRAGLGQCQGRVCGRNVAELARLPGGPDAFARRPLAAPVRLGELAEPIRTEPTEPTEPVSPNYEEK